MKRTSVRLMRNRRGFSAVSALLLYTIVAMGAVVGLVTLRNQLVQEYGDLSVALEQLDQSWQVKVPWQDAPVGFEDTGHGRTCGPDNGDPAETAPAGISLEQPPTPHG